MVEVVVAAILFAVASAGIFATITRTNRTESVIRAKASLFSKKILDGLSKELLLLPEDVRDADGILPELLAAAAPRVAAALVPIRAGKQESEVAGFVENVAGKDNPKAERPRDDDLALYDRVIRRIGQGERGCR